MLRNLKLRSPSAMTLLALITFSLFANACADATSPRTIASVDVSPSERSLVVGEELTLSVRAIDAAGDVVSGRTVTWTSSSDAVARVNAGGRVTAVSPGIASITATVDGKVGTAVLTVMPAPVSRVEVNPNAVSLMEGETRTLVALALDAEGRLLHGRNVTWISNDPAIADVDQSGRILAKRAGAIVVTASIEGRVGEVSVTVTRIGVASIAVTPTGILLDLGKTRQLTALVFDAAGNRLTDRTVSWQTDEPTVVTVSATGLISATGPGYATITASSEGKSFSVAATVARGEDDLMPYDLLYHRTTPQALGEIMVLGTSGGSYPVRINAGTVSRQPTASPNGNRIAFSVSQREFTGDQTDDIFAVDRNGMNMKRLTSAPGVDDQPAWSPAGDRIAYRHLDAESGHADIWVMNADGTSQVNLTADLSPAESVGSPEWSPDGARIAFASARSAFAGYASAIWTMNADGSNKRQVVSSPVAGDRSPTWSPDGLSIAFIRPYGDDTDISTVSAFGGAVTRLPLAGRQEGPAWSPDGRHFAYWQPVGISGATAIYSVRADGTNVRLHTLDPSWGGGYDPRWIRRQ